MDGDPVTGTPPRIAASKSLAEIFFELCPQYMAMGMTYDEFWNRNTKCHYAYRKAHEQKKRNRNWEMWIQGGYFYDALLRVAPVMRASFSKRRVEPGKYPEEPYVLDEKEKQDREEAKRKAKFMRMLHRFEMESAENKREQNAMLVSAKDGSTRDAQEGGQG